jgi:phosphoserine phosphatase
MNDAPHRQVLVLTGSATIPNPTVAEVGAALEAAGAIPGEPARLARSAVQIEFHGVAPNIETLRSIAGRSEVDANVLSVIGREKLFLIADMDSTIINVECIDEMADFAGLKPEVAEITEAAMRGELDFEAALLARVGLLKGLTESDLSACYAQRIRLNSGARTLVQTMRARGAATALVSGGFTYFTSRVSEAVGFAMHRANRLLLQDGCLTGDVGRPIIGRAAKLATLDSEIGKLGLRRSDVLAVGDGANDLDMVAAAGLGVAYRAKPALVAAADAVLYWSDLTALLSLQGISETDWQTSG